MSGYTTSNFSCQYAKNCLRLRVNDNYTESYPFTFMVEEALKGFCEYRGQIFKGIIFMCGVAGCMYGTYQWRRL